MRAVSFVLHPFLLGLGGSSCFFFQAEDGIRDLVRSRGLGDVYKRQVLDTLLVEGLQDHVSGAIGCVAGPAYRLFGVVVLSLIHI